MIETQEEAIEVADDDEPTQGNESGRERSRSPEFNDMTHLTVKQTEPDHGMISLEDLMNLKMARAKWLRVASELNVRFHKGNVRVSTTSVSSVTDTQARDDCAEEDRLIQEL
jgi:hypothetical protein